MPKEMDVIQMSNSVALFLVNEHFRDYIDLSFPCNDPNTIHQLRNLLSVSNFSDLYLSSAFQDPRGDKLNFLFKIEDFTLQPLEINPNTDDSIVRFYLSPLDDSDFTKLIKSFPFSISSPLFSPVTSTGKWWELISYKIKKGWVRSSIFPFEAVIIRRKQSETLEDLRRLGLGYLTCL
ncbi:MAG: hypothetical protein FHOMOCKG_00030 [Methanophagales virus GBV302]|uniref:Uncharacterized protein n=1 Tax=Methanophagales virus GBV302 TaxID=2999281 RepID=A0A9E8VG71_9CAUD|nr:MAG: hypothetical protein QIT37_gp030 [Methanophagales virus GBV302]WAE39558.1 MAG: hypothetical protein FHOMOCKG_00030 [Methanophagales virus GBV302]